MDQEDNLQGEENPGDSDDRKRKRRNLYDSKRRIDVIFNAVKRYGELSEACRHIESKHLKKKGVSPSSIRQYLARHDRVIRFDVPLLCDLAGNIIKV